MVKVCVVGCLHGELDRVYTDIAAAEEAGGFKTDLVLCCGDFQSLRNPVDLSGMSVPPKYYAMGDFWRYYSEERRAPVLTLFIGGNHEASGYLQELPYGGWVAPNIWYMGYAGVFQFGGLRIAGLSGIYKQHDYTMGHYEHPPYSESSKRSVYHVRNLEVFRLGQIRRPVDIVLSHDWPRGIYHYGNSRALIRYKPHFAEEIREDALGSPPAEQLLCRLRPRYWFSAHLHCQFAAVVQHLDYSHGQLKQTRFLALDKCLGKRDYIRFMDIDPQNPSPDSSLHLDDVDTCDASFIVSLALKSSLSEPVCNPSMDDSAVTDPEADKQSEEDSTGLFLDPEWLCILRSTNHLMTTSRVPCILPEKTAQERCDFSVTPEEIRALHETFGNEFAIPDNFERTAPAYKPNEANGLRSGGVPLSLQQQAAVQPKQALFSNPQTELLCAMLDLVNPNALLLGRASYCLSELSSQLEAKNALEEEDEEEEEDDNDERSAVDNEGKDDNDERSAVDGEGKAGSQVLADVEDVDSRYDQPPPATHLPDPNASWLLSECSGISADTTEYDPLSSSCMSPQNQASVNESHTQYEYQTGGAVRNPEEVYLEDIQEDDDAEDAVYNFSTTESCNLSPQSKLDTHVEAYSPQPVVESGSGLNADYTSTSYAAAIPIHGYVPTTPSKTVSSNLEEIPLPVGSESSEDDDTV
ncbi:lariat debranching enzyme [Clonorchis sinensis]|uniref:Lariat debranching enzyme n=1 Tax=Clonorchis sinensis TaxID=79923 RepID=A0A3R7GUS4_CLOSI|nr:lariat debranching enzyme [Clonorchis sinensis]